MTKPKTIAYYHRLAKKLIKEYADYERIEFEDRDCLERIILPYVLGNHNPQRTLDIGREDYQTFYNLYFENRELWTLDFDPKRKKFGAKGHHITDDVANVKNHFEDGYFNFILMNGVFGWGLNDPVKIEQTFESIYKLLAPGGLFILGWNDIKDLTPMPLTEIKALKKLTPYVFPPLESSQFKAATGEHTYNFYIKE